VCLATACWRQALLFLPWYSPTLVLPWSCPSNTLGPPFQQAPLFKNQFFRSGVPVESGDEVILFEAELLVVIGGC